MLFLFLFSLPKITSFLEREEVRNSFQRKGHIIEKKSTSFLCNHLISVIKQRSVSVKGLSADSFASRASMPEI